MLIRRWLLALALGLASMPAYSQIIPNYRCGTAPTGSGSCDGAMWTPLILNALTATKTAVKTTPGVMGIMYCYNPNTSVAYIQIYNALLANVTVGSTTPTWSIAVAPSSIGGFGFGGGSGLYFSTAMSVAATTTATGSSAPSTAVDCNVGYN